MSNVCFKARKLWKENVIIIENLDGNEPAPENVVINLQKAYESLSEVVKFVVGFS